MAKRKKDLGDALENLYRFLNLVGFISLLLGAVGVASAIQAHLQQKTATGAILRCLGASARTTVFVYLLQAAAMGLVGAIAGAALGRDRCNESSRASCKRFIPFAIPDDDRVAADCARHADRFRDLHPLRAAAAAAFSARFAAPRSCAHRSRQRRRRAARSARLWFVYALMAASVTAFAISQSGNVDTRLCFRRRSWASPSGSSPAWRSC